jgi:hypothetical protein
VSLAVSLVHSVEVRAEECGFVATGAGTDFYDGVTVVVGISWKEELVKL